MSTGAVERRATDWSTVVTFNTKIHRDAQVVQGDVERVIAAAPTRPLVVAVQEAKQYQRQLSWVSGYNYVTGLNPDRVQAKRVVRQTRKWVARNPGAVNDTGLLIREDMYVRDHGVALVSGRGNRWRRTKAKGMHPARAFAWAITDGVGVVSAHMPPSRGSAWRKSWRRLNRLIRYLLKRCGRVVVLLDANTTIGDKGRYGMQRLARVNGGVVRGQRATVDLMLVFGVSGDPDSGRVVDVRTGSDHHPRLFWVRWVPGRFRS